MTEVIHTDVAIIGSGPAGLSAATELKKRGITNVMVLEREQVAGGIPRHCAHPPYGVLEYHQLMTGPTFAKRNVQEAQKAGVDLRIGTTVVALNPDGELDVMSSSGPYKIKAQRVLLSTGVRETPRSARFVGGDRPIGVYNTGALQNFVHLKGKKPFLRPLIVGTELVSLSAIATCRKVGIKPVAMIDSQSSATTYSALMMYPKLSGVPVYYGANLESIHGIGRVEGATLRFADGSTQNIACDGILFTGKFTPDSALIRPSHLLIDNGTGGPLVDQDGRCSDPSYFAAGNVLRPVETAGWSYREAKRIGRFIAQDLAKPPASPVSNITVEVEHPIRFCVPQKLVLNTTAALPHLQLRVAQAVRGHIEVSSNGNVLYSKKVNTQPERRILIPLDKIALEHVCNGKLEIRVTDNG
ncbi:FAD-dependent oxidoreductase [Vibrio sp. CAIM 722]|uniref:FAD-dependent oxidoreductase n=1 Tax=Vibrio eleionomae TaxID=2653505 RepID=A0A7X4RVH2_9VIBR|nr:FAD-dependent oxidoreductase [Vibrio eleionomae]MZI94986.1 FAD-dependent oxidoreductase [Vibrio eleionomae]